MPRNVSLLHGRIIKTSFILHATLHAIITEAPLILIVLMILFE